MTVTATPGSRRGSGGFAANRDKFNAWRQTRPFWGAVLAIVGGIEIYAAAAAPMTVVVMQGLPGLLTMGVALLTLIMAGVTLYQPHLRVITGLIIIVLGPLSIMATNLGGFVVGMLLLVVGGALILAWAPAEEPLDLAYVSGDTGTEDVTVARTASSTDETVAGTRSLPPVTSDLDSSGLDRDRDASGANDSLPSAVRQAGSSPRPGQKKRPAPRTGLAGIFDTMFGTGKRKPPPRKPGQKRTPPPGKRPAGKRPAGSGRPPGSGPRPPKNGRPSGSSGTNGSGGSLSSLDRPSDPPAASARTWIVVPMLLVALASPAFFAGNAAAAPRTAADCGLLGLFCPPTPSPTAPSGGSTPAPTATPGLTLPTLPAIPGLTPPSATPSPAATTPATDCPKASSLTGATSPGKAADAAANAVKACAAAASTGNAPTVKAAAAAVPMASNEIMTLKATKMTMEGFSYAGVATVDTANGPVKTLHFSADNLAVEGMDQRYPFGGDTTAIKNLKGTATLKGHVELYVTSFKSNIYGLIPLTFSVDGLQPPLVLPSMFFTEATSLVVLATSDQILLPNLTLDVTSA